jgi:hypothetical protein
MLLTEASAGQKKNGYITLGFPTYYGIAGITHNKFMPEKSLPYGLVEPSYGFIRISDLSDDLVLLSDSLHSIANSKQLSSAADSTCQAFF